MGPEQYDAWCVYAPISSFSLFVRGKKGKPTKVLDSRLYASNYAQNSQRIKLFSGYFESCSGFFFVLIGHLLWPERTTFVCTLARKVDKWSRNAKLLVNFWPSSSVFCQFLGSKNAFFRLFKNCAWVIWGRLRHCFQM